MLAKVLINRNNTSNYYLLNHTFDKRGILYISGFIKRNKLVGKSLSMITKLNSEIVSHQDYWAKEK